MQMCWFQRGRYSAASEVRRLEGQATAGIAWSWSAISAAHQPTSLKWQVQGGLLWSITLDANPLLDWENAADICGRVLSLAYGLIIAWK